jgi:Zn-dependent peptidase ImmA (M78 family)/transcriptional regulator with XRE-family HTH domain
MGAGTKGFIPKKLTQGREVRGLTQTTLADLLHVTRAAVSQYEAGQRTPSGDVLLRLAEVLAVPLHFFMQDDAYEVKNAVFFRSMAAATKTARLRATRLHEWLVRVVTYLQEFVELPQVELPLADVPADPTRLKSQDIERIADDTRTAMGLTFGPISNVTWLVENKGGIIAELDLHSDALDAFSNWSAKKPFLILNSEKGSAVRWRYDLAHELGHMVLHHRASREVLRDQHLFRIVEDQANYFAGAFLLPDRTFGAMMPYSISIDTLVAVKPKWKVSIAGMIMRLRNLGLVSEKRAQMLFIGLSRRRWRTKEPFDDELEFEQPQLLRRAAELLISQNIISFHDMEASLGIAKEDIQKLLGYEESGKQRIIKLSRIQNRPTP